jgi:signal peptidase I
MFNGLKRLEWLRAASRTAQGDFVLVKKIIYGFGGIVKV